MPRSTLFGRAMLLGEREDPVFLTWFRIWFVFLLCTVTEPPHVLDEQFMLPPQAIETDKMNSLPSLNLSLKTDYESMEDGQHEMVEDSKEGVASQAEIPPVIPSFFPDYLPVSFPSWQSNAAIFEEEREKGAETSHHEVLKPIPVFRKEPVNVDELVGMSQLSIRETDTGSLKLLGEPSRQSAFHPSTPATGSDVNKGNNSVI